jgi:hypothetical protein
VSTSHQEEEEEEEEEEEGLLPKSRMDALHT